MEEQPGVTRAVRPRPRAWLLLSPGLLIGLLVSSCGAGFAILPQEYPGNHEAAVLGLVIGPTVLAGILLPLVNPLIQVSGGVLTKRNVLRVQRRWPMSQLHWIQLEASHLDAFLPDGTRAFRLSLRWWRKSAVESLGGSSMAVGGDDFPGTAAMARGVTLAADQAPSQDLTIRTLPITPDEARRLRSYMKWPRIAIGLAGLGAISVAVAAIVQERIWQYVAGGIAFVALPLAAGATWRWGRYVRELSAGLMIQATGTLELIDSGGDQRTCSVIVKGIEIRIPDDVADAIERHAILTKEGLITSRRFRFTGAVEYLLRSREALRVELNPVGPVYWHPAFEAGKRATMKVSLVAPSSPGKEAAKRQQFRSVFGPDAGRDAGQAVGLGLLFPALLIAVIGIAFDVADWGRLGALLYSVFGFVAFLLLSLWASRLGLSDGAAIAVIYLAPALLVAVVGIPFYHLMHAHFDPSVLWGTIATCCGP